MSRFLSRLSLVSAAVFFIASPCADAQTSRLNRLTSPTITEMAERFRSGPPIGSGPAAALFWNERLSEELIRDTFDRLASEHLREVFFYPTFGLDVEYLSDDYFRFYEFALAEAKRRGMKLWLYDEYSWPTGFAGGKLSEALPEAAAKGVRFNHVGAIRSLPEHLLGIYRRMDDRWVNIAEKVRNGAPTEASDIVAWLNFCGPELRLANGFYCDMLKKGVTEKFIELTHENYKKHSGGELGRTVLGVFTDEMTLDRAGGISWTDDLPERFEKKFGYSILDVLPLFCEGGDTRLEGGRVVDAAELLHHHKSALLDLYIERWSEPMFRWCEENGVEFSGHYEEHLWAYSVKAPDVAPLYVWHQRPTIDLIFNDWGTSHSSQAGNVRIVRELGSVAAQTGRARTAAETFGAAGWALLPRDMKRMMDWETVLGVTNVVEMGPQLSVRGTRKFDEGPSLYYHMPWWTEYDRLVDYGTRLSYLASQGRRDADLLVLQPTTTLWTVSGDGNRCDEIGSRFCGFLHAAERRQIEYDLGSEAILKTLGSVADGKLAVGQADYSIVVIPDDFDNIESETLDLMDRFVRNGGAILLTGTIPSRVSGKKFSDADDVTRALFEGVFGEKTLQGELVFERDTFPIRLESGVYQIAPESFFEIPWNADSYCIAADANETDGESFLDFYRKNRLDTPWLYHTSRQTADGEFLFFVNSDLENARTFRCRTAPANGRCWSKVDRFDLAAGDVSPFPRRGVERNGRTLTELEITLPPCGELALMLTEGDRAAPNLSAESFAEEKIEPLAAPEIERLDENVLTLDYVSLQVGDKKYDEDYFFRIDRELWRHYGYPQNPWRHIPQPHHEIIDRKFESGKGFETTYRFTIDTAYFDADRGPMYAVVELPDQYTIRCNGETVEASDTWWFDQSAKKVNITNAIRSGENVLTLTLETMNAFCDIVPIYLLGHFDLQSADAGFTVMAPTRKEFRPDETPESRSWNKMKMPFYGGRVAYRERFEIHRAAGERYFVQLPPIGCLGVEAAAGWNAALAKIFVNGREAGVIFSEPCRTDVTDFLKDGTNEMEAVLVGSPRNFCGPHYAGKYYIHRGYYGDFETAPEHRPAGDQYDFIPYGLCEPFVLIKQLPNGSNR